MIINANGSSASAADLWKGEVTLGDPEGSSPPEKDIARGRSQPEQAPYYDLSFSEACFTGTANPPVGGGAVGLVPYHLDGADCCPRHDPQGTGDGSMVATLDNGAFVLARFYGPIKKKNTASWSSHIKVRCRPLGAADPGAWVDVSAAFNVYGPGSFLPNTAPWNGAAWPDPRAIGLRLKNGYHVGPGVYLVHPAAEDSVQCTGLAAGVPTSPVVWDLIPDNDYGQRPGYVFVISGDCDGDGIPDQHDPTTGCTTPCTVADFNHSGAKTVQDIFDFLQAYFASCMGDEGSPCFGANADVNSSGDVSVQDIFDYLAAYFGCSS